MKQTPRVITTEDRTLLEGLEACTLDERLDSELAHTQYLLPDRDQTPEETQYVES